MKKLILILLFIPLVSFGQTSFENGFKEGFVKGYCGESVECVSPPYPVVPMPNLSFNSYGDGFARGIDAGREYKVGQFPIRALGRARASMDIMGVIKIISDKQTDEVLGVHMVAPRAADLIMEAVVAMEYRASSEDIARICHPHPTYSEGVKEAALAAWNDNALHI